MDEKAKAGRRRRQERNEKADGERMRKKKDEEGRKERKRETFEGEEETVAQEAGRTVFQRPP